jgi:hypothetical protein
MHGTFLLELWRAISPAEYRRLEKFLASPAHNQRDDVRALASALEQWCREGMEIPEKSLLFEAVFPGEVFDHLKFNYTCSFLAQRIEAFFIWVETEKEADWAHYFLCRALERRGAFRAFQRQSKALADQLHNSTLRNSDHHLMRFLLERDRYQHEVLHGRETPTDLQPVAEPLHRFFVLETLRWAGTTLSLKARYGAENPLPFTESALEYARTATDSPELLLARLGFETLSDVENEENFRNLKSAIKAHDGLFSRSEHRDLYLLAINFCLRRHNRGERPAYTREAFYLYREALDRELLLENGLLQKFTYNNILRLACMAGEWQWARQFLEDYRLHLPGEDRANTYQFNLASWHYLAGEYQKVPELLQTFDFTDRDMQISARQMLLRSYFETGEWQALDSLLKSFYTFLRRRHDIGYQRLMYLNLIKYTRKVMAQRFFRKKAALLAERIRKEAYIAEREWLLEKLSAKN